MAEPDGLHAVGGTGATGRMVVRELAARGKRVRAVNRRVPVTGGVQTFAAATTDPAGVQEACRGAAVVYHRAMPPFRRWVELFPPMMEAVIESAKGDGSGGGHRRPDNGCPGSGVLGRGLRSISGDDSGRRVEARGALYHVLVVAVSIGLDVAVLEEAPGLRAAANRRPPEPRTPSGGQGFGSPSIQGIPSDERAHLLAGLPEIGVPVDQGAQHDPAKGPGQGLEFFLSNPGVDDA